jgi:hypothetical protein
MIKKRKKQPGSKELQSHRERERENDEEALAPASPNDNISA